MVVMVGRLVGWFDLVWLRCRVCVVVHWLDKDLWVFLNKGLMNVLVLFGCGD